MTSIALLVLASFGVFGDEDWRPTAPPLEMSAEDAGAMPSSVSAEAAGPGSWKLRFTLPSSVRAKTAAVAGGFNGWSQTESPMQRGADGRWWVEVEAASGRYGYKYVVDGRWIPDPANEATEPDGFGGVNSLLRVGALGRADEMERKVGDGRIQSAGILHEPGRSLYVQRFGGDRLRLRVRTLADDVEQVVLEREGASSSPMARAASSGGFDFWDVEVALRGEDAWAYSFTFKDGELRASHPSVFRMDAGHVVGLRTPDWAKHATWYQIFPDRFRNGDPSNDPARTRAWKSDWDVPAEWEGKDGQSFWEYYVFQRMYGGDLAGVHESLDHIQSLGVNALYFNPVFAAAGSHRYNATDFRHIDPILGAGEDLSEATKDEDLLDPKSWVWTPSDRVFLDLLAECKRRGLRLILDGVFNHVGVAHPAFVDVRENGEPSRFADWFEIESFEPFRYAGWAGFGELPVFRKDADGLASQAVEDHIFAITQRWMDPDGDGDPSDGIDGWRLDVPMEIAMPFWDRWRSHVKSINPDAYITGEVWDRADRWLDGQRFDAVMNYPFAAAAIEWIGNDEQRITASEFDSKLALLRLAYPDEATWALMNLVDSHDTDRLVSMLANPDRSYDAANRLQDEGAGYDASKPDERCYRRARLIALIQMTYVGAPMVYYGDEVGMWGADDPVNRKPMLWPDLGEYANENDRVDAEHLTFYRKVGLLRAENAALRVGSFHTILTDDERNLWVFERHLGEETLRVAINAGDVPIQLELPDGAEAWESIFGNPGNGEASSLVPAIGGRVWRRRR